MDADAGEPGDADASEPADADPNEPTDADARRGRPCPFCETPMRHRHCKYVCPNHGVVYDCSDTFW